MSSINQVFDDTQDQVLTAMANLFSTGGNSGEAIVEEGMENHARVGRTNVRRSNTRLFPGTDVIGALSNPMKYSATTDYCMSTVQAARFTEEILKRCGMASEVDAAKYAFIQGMLLCFAMNSSSVLSPGRANFYVGSSTFNLFNDVVTATGEDTRRYFRAYADETRGVLEDLRNKFRRGAEGDDSSSLEAYEDVREQWEHIMRIADVRGLGRVPTLVHDSAEACSDLTMNERSYLNAARQTLFAVAGGKGNPVDNPVAGRVTGVGSGVRVGAVPHATYEDDNY